MPNITTEPMWQKWMGELKSLSLPNGIGNGQEFSAASSTLNVDLANADPMISNYNIYKMGDVIPANSPSYAPAASGLASSYSLFLNYVDLGVIPDPNIQSQLNLDAAAVTANQTNYINVQTGAYTAYLAAKGVFGAETPPFADWARQNYPLLADAWASLEGASANYHEVMTKAYGAGFDALSAAVSYMQYNGGALDILMSNKLNMAVKTGSVAPPGSGPPLLPGQVPAPDPSAQVSAYTPSYSLEGFTAKYSEWQAASVAGQTKAGGSISISSKTQTYDYSEFGWEASVQASWEEDFFSVGLSGQAQGQKVSVDTTSTDFEMTVDFTGLGAFSISPGLWWQNGSMVTNYHNKLKDGAPDFFGENGGLAREAYQLVVGFEPTITLTMESSDYSNVKSTWEAQASVNVGIGPFTIGQASGSAYGNKQNIAFDDAKNTVTIGPVKSTLPILLGVLSQRMGQ